MRISNLCAAATSLGQGGAPDERKRARQSRPPTLATPNGPWGHGWPHGHRRGVRHTLSQCSNWHEIARAELHPLRFAILERLDTPPPDGDPGWSASTLAQALELPLATGSHHVRLLRERGLLEVLESRQVRGAMQTLLAMSDSAADG